MTPKKLYRSSTDKMIAGVCGGIAKYLEVDATFVRVIFILLCFMGGGGILIYIILAVLIPLDTTHHIKHEAAKESVDMTKEKDVHGWHVFFGLVLVFIGIVSLSHVIFPDFMVLPSPQIFWPLIIIFLGLFILFKRNQGSK